MDVVQHNREAWNNYVRQGIRWSVPVSPEEIERARGGDWKIILTPNKGVPREWFGEIAGKRVLCLASAGGQQAPILAAAGAHVVSFDNSDEQLKQDELVARRDGLDLETIRGDMADLSAFEGESFDLILNGVSNLFVPDLAPVWQECARVLKPGGRLLVGFMNPMYFLFDHFEAEQTGEFVVRHVPPYTDLTHLPEEKLQQMIANREALEYGHSLTAQLAGQMRAGLIVTDLYEDDWDDEATLFNKFGDMFIATLARKISIPD